jgi:6-pyruvoyltetrahydropterin/6-carboxytetrahydropterin synthase
MYTIAKEFHFAAAHRLVGLPPEHKSSRLHGHSYRVEVVLSAATLKPPGFVVDYNDLAELGEYLDRTFDHRNLNEVVPFATTAENLARHLYEWCAQHWPQTVAVRVSETPKIWAEWRGPG